MADRYEMPIGFGMALMMNENAMKAFVNLKESDKQKILQKAMSADSRNEMEELVKGLSNNTMTV